VRKFIVTTTIQPPTEATLKFSKMLNWQMIIVGDLKTPHEAYENGSWIYLHPDYQKEQYPELSDAIGWNCIMRRNIGFVEAYKRGAEVVATIDDDNMPYDGWGENLLIGKTLEVDHYEDNIGVFDPLSVTKYPELWHRGYPIQYIKDRNPKYLGKKTTKVQIQADLWDGDPDIDATYRLIYSPLVKFDSTEPYTSEQITPFDSQNTFLSRQLIPSYMVLPHVGRMDDIWGGYVVQHLCGVRPVFCKPSVYQDRNEQSLIVNLEREIFGYKHTKSMLEDIDNFRQYLTPEALKAFECYQRVF